MDDNGASFELSPDPMIPELTALSPKEVLKRTEVFGTDLFADNMGDRVLELFKELDGGNGAVRATLHKYVNA